MNLVATKNNAAVIGLSQPEVACLRRVVALLRHPDPTIPALVNQALLYIVEASNRPYTPLSLPEDERLPRVL
jgi:hypothetical protein